MDYGEVGVGGVKTPRRSRRAFMRELDWLGFTRVSSQAAHTLVYSKSANKIRVEVELRETHYYAVYSFIFDFDRSAWVDRTKNKSFATVERMRELIAYEFGFRAAGLEG